MKRRSLWYAVLGLAAVMLWGLTLIPAVGAQEARAVSEAPDEFEEIERRPGEGERCIVCRTRANGDEVVEIRYKGRTFHVKSMMFEEFAQSPDVFFRDLQARGALFDERAMEKQRYSTLWLWFGVYVLLGLVCAAVCGALAVGRGLAPIPWFFAGLAGNVAALFVLFVTGKRSPDAPTSSRLTKIPTTHAPVACGQCSAANHPSATACSGCGETLRPAYEAEAVRA